MTRYRFFAAAILAVTSFVSAGLAQQADSGELEPSELGTTPNVHVCGSVFLAGQPSANDIATLNAKGIKRVITLRTDGEIDWNEAEAVQNAEMEFVAIPFRSPDSLTDDVFDQVRKLLGGEDSPPTLLHCASANRVGAVWMVHRVLDGGVPLEEAIEEAREVGLRTPAYLEKATSYIERNANQESVRPGINERFLQADLDVQEWLGRFEVESREVFAARKEILTAVALKQGDRVADIGAGTGLFSRLFAAEVGADGWVFAVDISPRFVEHIATSAERDHVMNLTAVLGSSRRLSLPPESIDVAFVCDTYHHFEYPEATLRSIHRALKLGGSLIVIDFERIPGKSREFILGHVRAGKDVFRQEIESAGFRLEGEVDVKGLEENYFLRFRAARRDALESE